MQRQQPRVRAGRVYDERVAEESRTLTLLTATRHAETSEAAVLTDLLNADPGTD